MSAIHSTCTAFPISPWKKTKLWPTCSPSHHPFHVASLVTIPLVTPHVIGELAMVAAGMSAVSATVHPCSFSTAAVSVVVVVVPSIGPASQKKEG